MNKKFWVVLALVVLALGFAGNVWAVDATEALNPQAEPTLMYGDSVDGIAKMPAGPRYSKTITAQGLISSTPIRVYMVNLYSATAGDMVGGYNDVVGGDLVYQEFEVAIAVNTSSNSINLNGLKIPELYLSLSNPSGSIATITYDY